MAVRFIIGRAGSGKTHYCLEAIRDRLRQDPIDGPRLILLVPEQASLQMERAILQPPGATRSAGLSLGGASRRLQVAAQVWAHRAEVLSFRRLTYRVLDSVAGPIRRALSEPARAMVLRHLVAQCSERLQYYRRVARRGGGAGPTTGFVGRLSATIAELIEEAVEPEDLVLLVGGDEPGPAVSVDDDPVQRAKLHDLHLIYQAYLDYLGDDKLDPSQHLQLAREHLGRCEWLVGAELWVDGFASLSGQETLILISLAQMCQHVDITVMMEPSLGDGSPARSITAQAAGRLFSRTYQTYQDLHNRFIQDGLEVEDPLLLAPKISPRFRVNDSLARLERSLFMPLDAPLTDTSGPPPGIELVALPSRRIEVDYAVSRVCRWVQDPHLQYRYRDIAIIVRDLEPYHDLLTQALTARGVPFFIDRRRPIAHHPLVELLRAGVALAAEAMSLESVRLALKTGLLPVSLEAADEIENYLIAHGIAGIDAWSGGDWSFQSRSSFVETEREPGYAEAETLTRINATRRALLKHLDPWLTFALPDPGAPGRTGADWAAAIVGWLTRLQTGSTLKRWADKAEANGDLDQAEEHRQVWRDVMSFLDDLAFAFANAVLTTEELVDVLEAGLAGLTLGLVPPMVDQVLVGSIERSRHPDIKAAVIVGFNDGVFPQQQSEDSILNDDDRATLHNAGLRIRPPSRERVFDESLLAYVALTRASDALVVTYATADNNGKSLRPSPYVDAFCGACPGLTLKVVGDPIRSRETWDILSSRDLAKRLTMEFRMRPKAQGDDPALRGRWNELYDVVRTDLAADRASRRAFAALDERDDTTISPARIESAFGGFKGPLQTSVSQLETYAACPFQHFARYILGLRERADATLEPVDVGHVHHAILEDFVSTLSKRGRGFGQLSDGELLDGLQESCARVATRLPEGGVLSDARNAYRLRRSASDLARVIQAQRRVSQSSAARPCAAELPFGFDKPGSLPAIELSTPGGRRVFLRGYLDRVDLVELSDELLGIVIDYKRTRDKHLHLDRAYHGLSLQLLAYLLVLRESGKTLAGRPVRPIGALYVSLASQYQSVDHPDDLSQRDLAQGGTYRPRGLLHADKFDALDTSAGSGWSDHYSLYRKKDGTLGNINHSDAADDASFQAMLDHTRIKLGLLADGILDGNVSVKPYRLGTFSPCSWCPMAGVCRFEMGISDVRFLESLKRSEVFQRLTTSTRISHRRER